MPKFSYKAKEGPNKIVNGVIDADNIDNAVSKIIQLGITPIDVDLSKSSEKTVSAKKVKINFSLFNRIGLKDVVVFTQQMSDLVDAAIPILRALQIVANQTHNIYLKEKVSAMHMFVKDGGSLSNALNQHSEIFSSLYINMVKTGEVSGQLEKVFARLAQYLDKEQETRSKVISSLAYPALILIVGVLTMFVLLTFVIPRITVMFDDLGQALPWPTVMLMSLSQIMAHIWWMIIAVCIIGGFYFSSWLRSENGRMSFDTQILKIPLLGEFIRVVEIGRFSRTLATLVESGVAITPALNSVWATINNAVLRKEIKVVSEDVNQGMSVKGALDKCTFFPDVAVNMVAVGEETGHLARGLNKIADTYERQADQTVKTIISLLGPLVLVVIVAFVGFVVIAMLLPIFQMNILI